jgi:hypothetical protein
VVVIETGGAFGRIVGATGHARRGRTAATPTDLEIALLIVQIEVSVTASTIVLAVRRAAYASGRSPIVARADVRPARRAIGTIQSIACVACGAIISIMCRTREATLRSSPSATAHVL